MGLALCSENKEAIKKLDEQLKCAICLDTYTDPKLLQCYHIYCRKCLEKLVIRGQQGGLSLTCHQTTPDPARSIHLVLLLIAVMLCMLLTMVIIVCLYLRVSFFGRKGEGPGEFDFLCSITVDESGVLYVCDLSNIRVQVY